MTPPEDRDELKRLIRELPGKLFEAGGFDLVNEGEDLLSREAAKLRKAKRPPPPKPHLSPKGLKREKYKEIIGSSPAMLTIFSLLEKVAPASVPVLIQGESGTGKEMIAQAIHKNSPRKAKEFVAENCAAIPETLLESELFGYQKGAFTGAEKNKQGLFQAAQRGTIFLDEIGDMSLNMQKKLLRVLQDGEIRPVGSNTVIHVDVRLISASNKNLQDLVRKKGFREDLYFRLNTITLELPPLRERKEDIPALCTFFVDKISKEMSVAPLSISQEALTIMTRYRWPGNIRELENEVRRCLALTSGEEIGLDDLSDDVKNCG